MSPFSNQLKRRATSMMNQRSKGSRWLWTLSFVFLSFFLACTNEKPPEKVIASTPEELDQKAPDIIRGTLAYAGDNNGMIDDSIRLDYLSLVQSIYGTNDFNPFWSSKEKSNPVADSLLEFIANARRYGLFPEDYHFKSLDAIRARFTADTLVKGAKSDAVLWSKTDLMLTDALLHMVKDLKLGRLPLDSISQRKDSVLTNDFYLNQFNAIVHSNGLRSTLEALEPVHAGYKALKEAIPAFLDSADYKEYTVVPPRKDTAHFRTALITRLTEAGLLQSDSLGIDSVRIAEAVKNFQRSRGLTVDGKPGDGTIKMLNTTDRDRFVRIAISLDRYKLLADTMPSRYVWVNLPSFYMQLVDNDTVLLRSKIVCGKSLTRTPLLTSAISNMVTYPQWTIPESIITKEILPGIKRDTAYLAKKGYGLIDSKGNEVDPATVDWSKYKKTIPYNVVQGSGDENALGVLKFNFPNKYAVYLHDTNQRYLFARDMRSLSHGCVRVQEWQELAYYIVRYDNREKYPDSVSPTEDSLTAWLDRKEKHTIGVKKKLPVYFRYITCEGIDGRVQFYDDIYGEDKYLQSKFFGSK